MTRRANGAPLYDRLGDTPVAVLVLFAAAARARLVTPYTRHRRSSRTARRGHRCCCAGRGLLAINTRIFTAERGIIIGMVVRHVIELAGLRLGVFNLFR